MPEIRIEVSAQLSQALHAYGISAQSICQAALEQEVNRQISVVALTPRARAVLQESIAVSERLGHGYVGTEHLLLALLDDEHGIAAQVLNSLGVTDAARSQTLATLDSVHYSSKSKTIVADQ